MKLIYLVSIFNHPFSKFHREAERWRGNKLFRASRDQTVEADVGKTRLQQKQLTGEEEKEEECVLADLCAAPKLFAQAKKSSQAPAVSLDRKNAG